MFTLFRQSHLLHLVHSSTLISHRNVVSNISLHFLNNFILGSRDVDIDCVQGAKADYGDKYGTTPLIWACRSGHTQVVQDLLEAGCQVGRVN
jgi:ankyrin repeat protein